MEILVTIEYSNNSYDCYSVTPIGDQATIVAQGETVKEAKDEFLAAVAECQEDYPDDPRYQNLTFKYQYDIRSFFDEFSYFNVNEIARRAGISPSLMRQYRSGMKKAGEKTYEKLIACVDNIKQDLLASTF